MDTRKRKLEGETDPDASTTISVVIPPPAVSAPAVPPASTAASAASASGSAEVVTPELLRMYYDRFFPCSLFMQWLSPAEPERLKLREFSFTLQGDIYIRYLSFATKEELKTALTTKLPIKIDVGAVYNAAPSMHLSVSQFLPVEKELVFDVDMTDYDDVRRCCSSAAICERCWPLMTAAIKVIDHMLRADFGFRHVLWVYSGRRGVHCWVCDRRARLLSNELRTAVVEYLSVSMGKEKGKAEGGQRARVHVTTPLHPALATAYETLLPFFSQQVEKQRWLEDADSRQQVLDYFDDVARPLFLFRDDDSDGLQRWEELVLKVNAFLSRSSSGAKQTQQQRQLSRSVQSVLPRIVLGHVYPRLDVNVSKQMNHLLKAPFCVHPKTGRVCVPIDAQAADEFDPLAVPTVEELETELNEAMGTGGAAAAVGGEDADAGGAAAAVGRSWEKTSLKPYIELFKKFVLGLQEDSRREKMVDKRKAAAAEDW